MMIYFDKSKQAYGYEIEDAIATVDDVIWNKYAGTELGKDYDILDGQFVKLRTIEEINAEMQRQSRIAELKQYLADTDYQAIKFAEGRMTQEEYTPISEQRQAWRDEINQLEKIL